MGKRKILLYVSMVIFLAGCSKSKAQEESNQAIQPLRLANVEVQTLHPTEFKEYLTLTGRTEACNDIILASELGGTVLELSVDRGDWVRKGEILAKVSADIYEAQLAEAEADLRLKQAALKKAQTLYQRGSFSSMQRLQAQVEHDAAAARVELAKSRLNRAIIRAPFDGVIDDRYVDQGEMVAPGGRLFHLVDLSRLKIKSEFAELDVSAFHPGITAEVHFDAFPDTVFQARLVFVASSAHQASGTFPCEFELENPNGIVRAGMLARVKVLKNIHHNVIVLQQSALVETEKGKSVFVLQGETAHKRGVTLGASDNGMVVVNSGLNFEETVIVTGQRDLVDGQQVRVTGRKD